MEQLTSMYYVYNQQNEVIQIRTRINHLSNPMYIIQYCEPSLSGEKIRYRTEIVDKKKFFTPVSFSNL